jgi:hypothetical protein
MKKLFRIRFFDSQSDDLKSKIQNRKLVGLFAIVVALTVFRARAEAQQMTILPWVGYLTGNPFSNSPARTEALRQGLRELGCQEEFVIGGYPFDDLMVGCYKDEKLKYVGKVRPFRPPARRRLGFALEGI